MTEQPTVGFPDIDIPDDETVYDVVFGGIADADLDRDAFTDAATGETLTFGGLRDAVDAFAGAVAARGFGPGDVIALHAPNSVAFVVAYHGVMRAGAAVTPIGALVTAGDVAFQLTDSGARALLRVAALGDAGAEGARRAGLSTVIDLDSPDEGLRAMLDEGHPAPEIDLEPRAALAALPYSSGTTGRPKGVQLSHRNLAANVRQTVQVLRTNRMTPGWPVFAPLPFFHIYGMNTILNSVLAARSHLITVAKFDLATFLSVHERHQVRFSYVAPPIMVALAKNPAVDSYDLSSLELVLSGAAPLDTELAATVSRRLGCDIIQGYGMTEVSPLGYAGIRDQGEVGSVGYPVPHSEGKLVDLLDPNLGEIPRPAPGAPVAPGDDGQPREGEVWIRGPHVMLGYHNNPEATARTIHDGWMRTGDIARYGPQGDIFIVDRAKELIKYKGYQVAPAELEALLLTHESIDDSAVVPFKRPEDGEEVPRAFVVLKEGTEITAEEVMRWVAERVAPYKKIRRVDFIAEIPKSASGKILRRELRAA